jgi:putative ABC transport system substrate-binding protein
MIAVARESIPGLRQIGTLTVPSEANSVWNTERLVEIASAQGLEVVQVAVNAISEVPDAAAALCSRDLDAIIQIGSNLTTSSFSSLSRAADSARIPVLSGLSGDLDKGAAVVIGRDYYDAGRQAAGLAVRIMNGESPAQIPFQPLETEQLLLNLDAARAQGLDLPSGLIARADRVIGERK